ncbi:MAG: CsbD family protein [Chloroflexi bacterium]|nr:CsbD family protein [Chloroflexota bacterium]
MTIGSFPLTSVSGSLGPGKVTGNKGQELHGKAKQIQGSGQQALGDVRDALRKPDDKPTRA